MKHLNKLLVVIFATLVLGAFGQNPLQKSFFWKNMTTYNPAFYGLNGNFSIQFQSSVRSNQESPSYSLVNVDGRVMKSLGIGASLISESFNNFKNTFFFGGASYGFVSNNINVNMGLMLGYMNTSFNSVEFEVNQFVDETDPFLTNGGSNNSRFVMGTGITVSNKLYTLGLSLPTLLKDGGEINPLINVYGNISFVLSSSLLLSPMVFISTDTNNGYFTGDFAAQIKWNNQERTTGLTFLTGYNTKNQLYLSPSFLFGFLDLGYAFRYNLGTFSEISKYNHEISLSFSIGKSTFRQVDLRDKYGHRKGKM